jgi:hypothetical protein
MNTDVIIELLEWLVGAAFFLYFLDKVLYGPISRKELENEAREKQDEGK